MDPLHRVACARAVPRVRALPATAVFLALLPLSIPASGSARAQEPEQEDVPVAAALPESNEAAILTAQVEQAIQFGDYRLAISLTRKIAELPEGLVGVPGARTYYPVWRQALRLLGQLPPEATELYRQMFDAQVQAELNEAALRGDLGVLRRLFRTHRASGQWEAVGGELVAQLIDRGNFGEAIDILRILSECATSRSADLTAQLTVALGHVGASRAAGRALDRLATELRNNPQPGWAERLTLLRNWLTAEVTQRGEAEQLRPLRSVDANWSLALLPVAGGVYDSDDQVADTIDTLRRLPLIEPVIDGDTLFVRARGTVWAIDALTLTTRWRVGDMRASGGDVARESRSRGDAENPPLSEDAALLFTHALRHTLSTGFGKVFTIDALTLFEDDSERFGWQGIESDAPGPVPNALVARDRADGRVVWRAGVDADDPLFGVAFQDAPLVVGAGLCAAFQRGNELRVALLDPETGARRQELMVVGPPTAFSAQGGRCLLTSDETTIYVCTGNGVVAALDRDDLSWKWATVYPGTRQERRGRWRWMTSARVRMHNLGAQRPFIAEDLLIICPPDAPFVFAFDRFNGRQVWPPIERSAFDFVIGAAAEGLLVAGNSVACLSLTDGQTVRWRSVPMEIAGKPCIAGDRVFVPTTAGLVTLDARNGRVLDDAGQAPSDSIRGAAAPAGVGAVLLADSRALYGVSPGSVFKQPDVDAAGAEVRQLLMTAPSAARGVLADAWLKLLAGRDEDALSALQTLDRSAPQIAAACDRLLAGVFLALARKSADAPTRLDWLKRATELASGPDGAAAGLMLYAGRTLEESGQLQSATAHYCDMLSAGLSEAAIDARDPRLRRAGWTLAIERLDALLRSGDSEVVTVLTQRIASAAAARDFRLLRRLGGAALPDDLRSAIDAELAVSNLPYELTVGVAEAAARRNDKPALWLERWAAHVALGRFSQAEQDQAEWVRRHGDGAELSEVDRATLARVRRDMEKLAREQAPPFDASFFRPWKMPASELLLATDGPQSDSAFLLARSLSEDSRALKLISAATGQAWRVWTDGLEREPGAPSAIERSTFSVHSGHDDVDSGWPVALYGSVAAVPVPGGLVGVGLGPIGPEKRAAARLWESSVVEWSAVPDDFQQVCAAGPEGVCVLTPRRRLMLLDWFDGRILWERELAALDAVRMVRAGPTLLLIDRDDQLWALNWEDGKDLGRFQSDNLAVHEVVPLDNRFLLWSDLGLSCVDVLTRQTLWTRAEPPGATSAIDPDGACLALRQPGGVTLIDLHSGQTLIPNLLADMADVTAVARLGDRAYVAGLGASPDDGAPRSSVHVCCVELPTGRKRWSHGVESVVSINRSALAANPNYIPVLIERASSDGSPDARVASLAIQLIERDSGRALEPVSIAEQFRNSSGEGPTYMLTTPSRMIVQFGGAVAAFGSSRPTREP